MKLEALKPPADMGAMVGGGASGATSRLTITSNAKVRRPADEKVDNN